MKFLPVLAIVLAVACMTVVPGCIFPRQENPPATPSPGPAHTTPVTETTGLAAAPGFTQGTPGTTQVPPPGIRSWLQVLKLRPFCEITLQWNGGEGLERIDRVQMNVTLSDGSVISRDLAFSHPPGPSDGDKLIIPGTPGRDRAEVWITVNGTEYKVLDEIVPEPGV